MFMTTLKEGEEGVVCCCFAGINWTGRHFRENMFLSYVFYE